MEPIPQVISYTALGDSLTVGVGSSLFAPGFTERYAHLTESTLNKPVVLNTFARSGATTGDVLYSLDLPIVASHVATSDIITITAGGDDMIHAAEKYLIDHQVSDIEKALEQSMTNYTQIINKINTLHHQNQHVLIRIINIYNPLPQINGTDQWISRFNQNLSTFTKAPYIEVVDISRLFASHLQQLLSQDHIHPNDLGYEKIAEIIYQTGYQPLR